MTMNNPFQPPLLSNGEGASPTGGAMRINPVDPLRVLRQYLWVWIVALVLGGMVAVGIYFMMLHFAPVYTSTAYMEVMPGPTGPYDPMTDTLQNGGTSLDAYIQTQVTTITSDDIINAVLARDDVKQTQWYRSFDPSANIKEQLQKQLSAQPITGSTLFQVSMGTHNRNDAPVIVGAVVNVYMQQLQQEQELDSGSVRQTFVHEVQRAQTEYNNIQNRITTFLTEKNLPGDLSENYQASVVEYNYIAQQYAKLALALQQSKSSYQNMLSDQAKGQWQYTAADYATVRANPAVLGLENQIDQVKVQRDVFRAEGKGDNHRLVQDMTERIASLQQQRQQLFDQLLRQQQAVAIEQAKQTVTALTSAVEAVQPKLKDAQTQMRDLSLLLQQYQNLKDQLQEKDDQRKLAESTLEQVRVQVARPDTLRVRVAQAATLPRLTSPQMLIVIPGVTFLVLMLTAGVVFLREMLDQRLRSPADVALLKHTELLGVLPDAQEDPSNPARVENIVRQDPTGLMAESFRQVRSGILTRMDRRGYKTLMIIGPQAGGGVSTVTNNLALSLAYNGRKVLVVDANFRRPTQHTLFDRQPQPGLAELLRGSTTLDQAIQVGRDVPVDVLPAGTCQDAQPELFEGPTCRDLFAQLESRYDLVLVDTPPALVVSEGNLLSRSVDAIVIVARAMSDKRGMISRMTTRLSGQRADVLGLVINGVRSSAGGYFRQNYRAFYRYRGADRRSKRAVTKELSAN